MNSEVRRPIRAFLLRIGIAFGYASLAAECFRLVWSGGKSGFAEERAVGRWESGQLATRFAFGSAGEVGTTFLFSFLLWATIVCSGAALGYVVAALNTLSVRPWEMGDPNEAPSVFERRSPEERARARERERFHPATILRAAGMWLLVVAIFALLMAAIFTFGFH